MRLYTTSDVYATLNANHSIDANIKKVLSGGSGTKILNGPLMAYIDTMMKVYREPTTVGIVQALKGRDIMLVQVPVDYNLPECLPFIKFRSNGKEKVLVNVSRYVSEKKDKDSDELTYGIDVKKLYSLTLAAYIYLKLINASTVLPPITVQLSSVMWAKMFNKVLNKTIGLSMNKERYEAFMYFAIKFFIMYYLEQTEERANSVAMAYISNTKSYMINLMESKMDELNLSPFTSFRDFCSALFNNEVSNIKGIKVNNVEDRINFSYYAKQFIQMYNFSAFLSLASYPYFLFAIISAYNMDGIVNNRSMEDIVKYDMKDVGKLLSSIYKEL